MLYMGLSPPKKSTLTEAPRHHQNTVKKCTQCKYIGWVQYIQDAHVCSRKSVNLLNCLLMTHCKTS